VPKKTGPPILTVNGETPLNLMMDNLDEHIMLSLPDFLAINESYVSTQRKKRKTPMGNPNPSQLRNETTTDRCELEGSPRIS